MYNIIVFVVIFAAWFILMRWVLPWFGLPTCCMGGACPVSDVERSERDRIEAVPAKEESER